LGEWFCSITSLNQSKSYIARTKCERRWKLNGGNVGGSGRAGFEVGTAKADIQAARATPSSRITRTQFDYP
jgi:hypothetical protein